MGNDDDDFVTPGEMFGESSKSVDGKCSTAKRKLKLIGLNSREDEASFLKITRSLSNYNIEFCYICEYRIKIFSFAVQDFTPPKILRFSNAREYTEDQRQSRTTNAKRKIIFLIYT